MWAMDNITTRSNISVNLANLLIDIRFHSIDEMLDGNCQSLAIDAVFVSISNMCCASFCDEFEMCKQRVKQYKAAKRRKSKKIDDGAGDAGDEEEQEDEAEKEMPVFEPPVMISMPTYLYIHICSSTASQQYPQGQQLGAHTGVYSSISRNHSTFHINVA